MPLMLGCKLRFNFVLLANRINIAKNENKLIVKCGWFNLNSAVASLPSARPDRETSGRAEGRLSDNANLFSAKTLVPFTFITVSLRSLSVRNPVLRTVFIIGLCR
ncbi:MAG: hypothetical protein GX640_12240 [Fibrobacter sp.]|nr:hypothetical protein [Fibrobacter sp.]